MLKGWRSNKPLYRTPARPARCVKWTQLTIGKQGQPATYEGEFVCDDLKIRTFTMGADGTLTRKR